MSSQFPVTLAEAYAMQFGAVYLNFTVAAANQRFQELATYLSGTVTDLAFAALYAVEAKDSGRAHLMIK